MSHNLSAKRKSLGSLDGKPSKKLKQEEGGEGQKEKKRKKSPLNPPLSPTLWNHMQVIEESLLPHTHNLGPILKQMQ